MNILNGVAHFFGLDNGSGANYLFWSGIGSDLTEIAILGALVQWYRHHVCHVRRCWRPTWKLVPGTDHSVCRKHHPHDSPTAQQVLDDHRAAHDFEASNR